MYVSNHHCYCTLIQYTQSDITLTLSKTIIIMQPQTLQKLLHARIFYFTVFLQQIPHLHRETYI